MFRLLLTSLFLIWLCLAADAGELGGTTVGSLLTWKPTACQKPPKLFFNISDVDSYNAAVEEYNHHLLLVRTYRSCIAQEAQRDAETTSNAISTGLDQANEQLRLDLDAARADLESAKRLLQ